MTTGLLIIALTTWHTINEMIFRSTLVSQKRLLLQICTRSVKSPFTVLAHPFTDTELKQSVMSATDPNRLYGFLDQPVYLADLKLLTKVALFFKMLGMLKVSNPHQCIPVSC